jgi:ribonucleotide reductase beta subunit family protein with ferritin-like domain
LESKFWTAEDIELGEDLGHFEAMTGKEKSHICQLICYSLLCAQKLSMGLPFRFCNDIQSPEARCFFGFQQMQENIHLELWGLMLENLTSDLADLRSDTLEMMETCIFIVYCSIIILSAHCLGR